MGRQGAALTLIDPEHPSTCLTPEQLLRCMQGERLLSWWSRRSHLAALLGNPPVDQQTDHHRHRQAADQGARYRQHLGCGAGGQPIAVAHFGWVKQPG